jgi:phage shock protein A
MSTTTTITPAQKRADLMAQFRERARLAYDRGDMTLARQAAANWAHLATHAQLSRAPHWLRRCALHR